MCDDGKDIERVDLITRMHATRHFKVSDEALEDMDDDFHELFGDLINQTLLECGVFNDCAECCEEVEFNPDEHMSIPWWGWSIKDEDDPATMAVTFFGSFGGCADLEFYGQPLASCAILDALLGKGTVLDCFREMLIDTVRHEAAHLWVWENRWAATRREVDRILLDDPSLKDIDVWYAIYDDYAEESHGPEWQAYAIKFGAVPTANYEN